jgi:uncharacterized protein (TIGR03437 family)
VTASGLASTPGFQGYIIAQCQFQYAHGFAFISDLGAQRLAQGYLALVLDEGLAEVDRRVPGTEIRGEQLGNIRALGSEARLAVVGEREQSTTLRFEPTSEGYLPKRPLIASFGSTRLSGFTTTVQTTPGPGQTVGDSWLRATQMGTTTPLAVEVSVDPEGLAPGTYNGSVRVAPSQAGVAPAVIPVELVVPPAGPHIRTFGVVSAGSYAHSVIAPGEAVVIFGDGFGPAQLAGLTLTNGVVSSVIGETRILFDGEAAPMIYSVTNQASAFVPFSVEGKKFVDVVVEYKGAASPPARLAVLEAKPAILTADQSGGGIGAILNQDNSFNFQKGALPGEIIQIFGIGGGQTTPPQTGGRLQAGVAEFKLPVRVFIDGVEVPAIYAGPAPGLVEGVFQVNVQLRNDIRRNTELPILIYFGDELHTQPGVTVRVG